MNGIGCVGGCREGGRGLVVVLSGVSPRERVVARLDCGRLVGHFLTEFDVRIGVSHNKFSLFLDVFLL